MRLHTYKVNAECKPPRHSLLMLELKYLRWSKGVAWRNGAKANQHWESPNVTDVSVRIRTGEHSQVVFTCVTRVSNTNDAAAKRTRVKRHEHSLHLCSDSTIGRFFYLKHGDIQAYTNSPFKIERKNSILENVKHDSVSADFGKRRLDTGKRQRITCSSIFKVII